MYIITHNRVVDRERGFGHHRWEFPNPIPTMSYDFVGFAFEFAEYKETPWYIVCSFFPSVLPANPTHNWEGQMENRRQRITNGPIIAKSESRFPDCLNPGDRLASLSNRICIHRPYVGQTLANSVSHVEVASVANVAVGSWKS